MKYAKIGGQAVIEGVMMKHGTQYAVAVRKPDHEIEVKTDIYEGVVAKLHWQNIPVLRGVAAFIDSLYLGMATLTWAAGFVEDEDEPKAAQDVTDASACGENEKKSAANAKSAEPCDESEKKDAKSKSGGIGETLMMAGTVIFSIVLALGLFMALPFLAANLLGKVGMSNLGISIVEGIIRIVIFLLYIILISKMKDIQRTFMYHGAEHKTISCIESGMELNVENAAKCSRLHKRCGTSFLLIVVILSVIVHILFFAIVPVEGTVAKLVIRLLLVPVIAGFSYEFLQWTGRHDSCVVNALSKPGLWLQKLTTREPEPEMLEVAIASIEAIYDWRAFQEELKADSEAAG